MACRGKEESDGPGYRAEGAVSYAVSALAFDSIPFNPNLDFSYL